MSFKTDGHLWLSQFRILLWKNFVSLIRSPLSLVLRMLLPIAILVIFSLSSPSLNNNSEDFRQQREDVRRPPAHKVSMDFPTCNLPCYTLTVSPDTEIMRDIISNLIITRGQSLNNVKFFSDSETMAKFLYNGTSHPVLAAIDFRESSVSNEVEAIVRLNASSQSLCSNAVLSSFGYSQSPCFHLLKEVAYPLHTALQQSLLSVASGKEFKLDLSYAYAPHPPIIRASKAADGGVYVNFFFLVVLLLFCFLIIDEKKSSMRAHLIQSGMFDSAYWLSWIITIFILMVICAILILSTAFILKFQSFLKNDFAVILYTLLHVIIHSSFTCSFISSLVSTPTGWAGISVLSILFNLLVSNFIPLIVEAFKTKTHWKYLTLAFPSALSSPLFQMLSAAVEDDGPGIRWKDLEKISPFPGATYSYTGYLSLMRRYSLLFFVLNLYLAHVFPKRPSGPFGDFLLVFNWIREKIRERSRDLNPDSDPQSKSNNSDLALASKRAYDTNRNVVTISQLSMRFYYGWFWLKKTNALNSVTAGFARNQTTAIVGQNGKSTLLNILLGEFVPKHGSVLVFGHNVVTQKRAVRRKVNVVPQFDCLFEHLTALENMIVLGRIRDIPYDQCIQQSLDLLDQVNLLQLKDRKVGTFSGGMQRRLSVCLGFLGPAELVLVDEGTSGLSPMDKQKVQLLMQREKQKRTIAMVDHDLFSADLLSDTVVMLHQGNLVAFGAPLNLKARYGKGVLFTVSLIENATSHTRVVNLIEELKVHFTQPVVASNETITFSVSNSVEAETVLRALEAMKNDCQIDNVGVNMSGLDEVFLNIIKGQGK
ncbi:hypothetical protein RCL1_005449 [Eukaryota sp. TZLM3-RCL]